jgi:hypothetical protein
MIFKASLVISLLSVFILPTEAWLAQEVQDIEPGNLTFTQVV